MDKNPNKFPVVIPKINTSYATSHHPSALKGLLTGTFIGICEVAALYPTEYIKTQLQLDEKGEKKKFNGIFDVVKKTIERRGIFGLYRGLGIVLLCGPPRTGIRFGSHELLKNCLRRYETNSTVKQLVAGLGAGALEGMTIVTPMETIKVKIIHDQRSPSPQYRGIAHAIKEIVHKEGLHGIYQGFTATIIRQTLSHGLRFFFMDVFKDVYSKHNDMKRTPTPIVGIFSIIASVLMVYLTNPIDVIKTRMQSAGGPDTIRYKSPLHCGHHMLANEGVRSFYKGSLTRCIHVSCSSAFTFMLYDILIQMYFG